MKYLQTTPVIERGILNSSYKQEIKEQSQKLKQQSISRMKRMVLNHQTCFESATGTLLRVSVFMVAIIFMIS